LQVSNKFAWVDLIRDDFAVNSGGAGQTKTLRILWGPGGRTKY